MKFFTDSVLFGSITGFDLILNLLCISHKLAACWDLAGFRNVPVLVLYLNWVLFTSRMQRGGYKSLTVVFLQRTLIFMVVFMGIVIPGLSVCTAEVTQMIQDKTYWSYKAFSEKFPALFRPWQSCSRVRALPVATCWKESRSRWLLCKCGETLSERLLKGEKIRGGKVGVLACPLFWGCLYIYERVVCEKSNTEIISQLWLNEFN